MARTRGRDREPPQHPLDGSGPSLNSHYGNSSFNREARPRRRRAHRESLEDFRAEAPESDGGLKLEDYLEWVQYMKSIIKIKGYSREKAFKLAVLKLK